MKEILFIANYPFPSNVAYASRIFYFCKIFNELGYHVTVICHKGGEKLDNEEGCIRTITFAPLVSSYFINLRNFLFAKYSLGKILNLYIKENKPEAVILGGGYSRLFNCVHSFGKKHRVPVIVEACEWYDWTQIALGPISPMFWDNRLALWFYYKKADAFIGISTYLQNYYKERGVYSLRIPTILDTKVQLYTYSCDEKEKMVITYAGYPAKRKDYIDQVIIALAKSPELQKKIKLNIIGPTTEKIEKILGNQASVLKEARSSVVIHGMKKHEEINEYLIKSDFTVLLRPNKRYAYAGFPTKVAESMAAGIPVISNLTGDIGLYLKNMENGIICKGFMADECIDTLKEVVSLSKEEIIKLKANARKTAEENFDYRIYVPKIEALMGNLKKKMSEY